MIPRWRHVDTLAPGDLVPWADSSTAVVESNTVTACEPAAVTTIGALLSTDNADDWQLAGRAHRQLEQLIAAGWRPRAARRCTTRTVSDLVIVDHDGDRHHLALLDLWAVR